MVDEAVPIAVAEVIVEEVVTGWDPTVTAVADLTEVTVVVDLTEATAVDGTETIE